MLLIDCVLAMQQLVPFRSPPRSGAAVKAVIGDSFLNARSQSYIGPLVEFDGYVRISALG